MKCRRTCLLILAVLYGLQGLPAQADEASSLNTGRRVALVIGNSGYAAGPLANPANDAGDMAEALRSTGFEVLEYTDLETPADMKKAVREFGGKIRNGGTGLFYFAGHGIQVDGKNYLIPTKAEIHAEEEVEYESLDLGFVLAMMEIAGNRMNILILDACRNNPFSRSWRSAPGGLAFMDAPSGTLIAYATAPGSVASDGTGENGLYTEELLRQIGRKGMKIEDVFKNVRAAVMSRSNNRQTPWESSSLVGDFYFVRPDVTPAKTGAGGAIAQRMEPDGLTRWKRDGQGYRFYQSGADMSSGTATASFGDDVLLYDRSSGRNYILENYRNTGDDSLRNAVEVVSRSDAFWLTGEKDRFWFYYRGNERTESVKYAWCRENLIVYSPEDDGRYFLLPGFGNAEPGRLYEAEDIYSPNHTLWWADARYYYLYVKGDPIATRTYWQWSGNDLIVYDEQGGSSYLLPGYYNHTDEVPQPAEVLAAPGSITWSKSADNTYWLYRNGMAFPGLDAVNEYVNGDLLVYDRTTRQDFLLKDFRGLGTDVQYPAEILWSAGHAFWRRSGSDYRLYVKGSLAAEGTAENTPEQGHEQDLEVSDPATGEIWILKGFRYTGNDTLHPASLKE